MPHDYAVDYIVHLVGEGDNIRYVLRWYCFSSAEGTVEPPEHIPEHIFTRYWRGLNKRCKVKQRWVQRNTNGTRKVAKKPTLPGNSIANDYISVNRQCHLAERNTERPKIFERN